MFYATKLIPRRSRRAPAKGPGAQWSSVSRSLLPSLRVGFAALLLASVGYAGSDPTPWGRPVLGIDWQLDARLTSGPLASRVTQKVGEPLDQSKVSESLRNLYQTGRFVELRADVQEKPPGVVLVFVGHAQYFVGLVRAEGAPKGLESTRLTSAARLRLGQPFSDEDLNQARQRIVAVLANDGYYQARVDFAVERHPEDQEADITFTIVAGQPARLSGVEFQGHPVVPPARLASVARWRPRTRLTSDKLDNGLFRIHNLYVKLGRLKASTSIQKRSYDPQSNAEKLIVEVEAGPEVRVHIRGVRMSSRQLKRLLPVYREGATDELALNEGSRKLEEYFEERGYFTAKAKVDQTASPDSPTMDITYTVTLGPRGDFMGFAFKGDKSISEDDFDPVMEIEPRELPRLRGTFNNSLLEHDVKAMTMLYQARGFPDARITPEIDDHYEGKPGRLFITFNIAEGPLVKVGQLRFRGVSESLQKQLQSSLLARPGQPFSPARAQADKETLLTYFGNQGYSRAVVSWQASPVSPAHEVDLEYTVEPGPRETIQQIIFMGNEHTRGAILDRELRFNEGEPLSQSSLLESQQRLYDLGVFNQVQIARQDPESPETEGTVLVNTEEAKRWFLQYGFGFDVQSVGTNKPQGQLKASPRVSLEVSRQNVFGRAQTLTARGRFSNLETGGAISYLIPRFAKRRNLDLRFTVLSDQSRDVATFSASRQEGTAILTRQYSPATFLSGRYTYRRVKVFDINAARISKDQIPLVSQPVRIALFGLSYVNDQRDNPADATRGSYSLADSGVATTRLGSEANFLRASGQNATYYKLVPHLIFARNTRIGLESPFGGLQRVVTNAGPVFTLQIPLPERFFMGGSESHRGFGLNQAGPRDLNTGFPIGGNALLLNTFELRTQFWNNRLGLVLFHDAGNVYSSIRRMRLLKFSQSSPTDFDYTVHAVGLGVRYRTPVAPVRFDVAYSFNPPRFRVCNDTNNPQSCLATGQGFVINQLPHLQFFISIGQSF